MADHGVVYTVENEEPVLAAGYGLTTMSANHATVLPIDIPYTTEYTYNYALTGTLQPDAGNPPPNAGQIWPRGATQT